MKEIVITDRHRLGNLRKKANRRGYRLSKTRWHYHTIDNYGGVIIVDNYNNVIVAGDRYSLTLDEADRWLADKAERKQAG
jgi:hypothetical protein